jgi:hypothetical protein
MNWIPCVAVWSDRIFVSVFQHEYVDGTRRGSFDAGWSLFVVIPNTKEDADWIFKNVKRDAFDRMDFNVMQRYVY